MIFILSCHHGRIEEQSGTAHGDYLEFANSSNIVIEQLDSMQIENLTNLGLIWGFLKYYHPNIAKGNYNWDYELFKIFPEILKSENNSRTTGFAVRNDVSGRHVAVSRE